MDHSSQSQKLQSVLLQYVGKGRIWKELEIVIEQTSMLVYVLGVGLPPRDELHGCLQDGCHLDNIRVWENVMDRLSHMNTLPHCSPLSLTV